MKKHIPLALSIFFLGVFFVLSLVVSWQESTTMDEQAHIPAGYSYVKYFDMRLNPEHPPLLKDLAGIPLLFMDLDFPRESTEWKHGINEQWTIGNTFIHSNDAQEITFWSRFPIILIALLLGAFLYIWTKKIAGAWAALGAVTLFAFDPNIIAHSHYVTTDIGIAAFIFFSFYFGIRFLENPSQKNVVAFGIALGFAQLAKFSAFMLFPFFGLLTLIYALAISTKSSRRPWLKKGKNIVRYWLLLAEASLIAFIPIWILYIVNTWNMPPDKILEISSAVFGDTGLGIYAKAFIAWIIQIPVLSYLTEYFLGLFMVFVRVSGGNTYYFLGEVSNQASPTYFPVVFFLKETVPFLFLLLLASSVFLKNFFIGIVRRFLPEKSKGFWEQLGEYIRNNIAPLSMGLFVVFYAYLSITSNLNIGFRHLFPILPFLYVLIVLALVSLFNRFKKLGWERPFKIFLGIIFLWILLIPFIHYPSYLSYFNAFVGGPEKGYTYVTDSNYDWGQDLKRLRQWVDNYNASCLSGKALVGDCHDMGSGPIEKIRIDYFGGSNPQYYFGDQFIPWNAYSDPEPGWYAISIGFFQESIYKEKDPGEKSYEWLTRFEPIDRAGDSIFIYYVPESALNQ